MRRLSLTRLLTAILLTSAIWIGVRASYQVSPAIVRLPQHGARSAKQAIAIGLAKARRAGVKLPAPKKGKASKQTRKQAARDLKKGKSSGKKKSAKRSRAMLKKLKREGHSAASKTALSRQARGAAKNRSAASRSRSAQKAAQTRKK